VRTRNRDGRNLITLTRGDRIAIFAHVQQDCFEGAMEINFVKAKWRNFVPVPEVEYIKGYFNRDRLCVLMTEDRRARVTCGRFFLLARLIDTDCLCICRVIVILVITLCVVSSIYDVWLPQKPGCVHTQM